MVVFIGKLEAVRMLAPWLWQAGKEEMYIRHHTIDML